MMAINDPWPAILSPYLPQEVIGTKEAAERAGVCVRTIREWCDLHRIGRRIGGRWKVSAVALDKTEAGRQRIAEAQRRRWARWAEDRGSAALV